MILFTVMRRDLAEYRLTFPLALLLGAASLMAPLLPGLPGSPAEVRVATAGSLGALLGLTMVFIQAGTLGRDLASGRLAFWLTRPVSLPALVAGRLGASLALAIGILTCAMIPVLLRHPGSLPEWWGALGPLATWVLVLSGTIHLWSTALRDRSGWLLLDALLLLGTLVVIHLVRRQLEAYAPFSTGFRVHGTGFMIYGALALVGAWLQLHFGHGELRRGHRMLTTFMAIGLSLSALVGMGWVQRVTTRPPTQQQTSWFATLGAGWAMIGDFPNNWYSPSTWLVNAQTGRMQALPFGRTTEMRKGIIAGFRHECAPLPWQTGSFRLQIGTPTSSGLKFRDTHVEIPASEYPDGLALDPAGRHALLSTSKGLSLIDLKLGTALPLETSIRSVRHAKFRQPHHVDLLEFDRLAGVLRMGILDLRTHRIAEQTLTVHTLKPNGYIVDVDHSTHRAILASLDSKAKVLIDLESGKVLSHLPYEASTRFLPDGRLLSVLRSTTGALSLTVWNRSSKNPRGCALTGSARHRWYFVFPLSDRECLVTAYVRSRRREAWRVHLDSGLVGTYSGSLLPMEAPGPGAPTFWIDTEGQVWTGPLEGPHQIVPGFKIRMVD